MDQSSVRAAVDGGTFQTGDLDVARSGVQAIYGDLRADVTGPFAWRARIAQLGSVTVVCSSCDKKALLQGTPAVYVLELARAGVIQARATRDRSRTTPGRVAAVFSAGEDMDWASEGWIETVSFCIDQRFLAAQFEALSGEPAPDRIRFGLSLPIDRGVGAYLDRLGQFIAGEIDRSAPLDTPAAKTGLVESLARALIVGHGGEHAHLWEKPPPSSRTIVRLAEEYIDAHAGEPIALADLAAAMGAPVRAIEAAFSAHRGTTIGAFLRDRRLEHARRILLRESHVPVRRVAHAAGFLRRETFEAAYVAAFRERPEDTRRMGLLKAGALPPGAPPPEAAPAARIALLSPRERAVCERVARGLLNKQIADELGITERTVKEHRARAMAKLGARSAGELGKLFR